MDLRKILQGVSKKLLIDFESSAIANHQVVKGDFREGALKTFLNGSRMPEKYKIGSGEICDSHQQVSKQCDLIVYDRDEGVPLYAGDEVQIFPIEVVYGVVEVKSGLSKVELLKGLENIKSVKKLLAESSKVTTVRSGRHKSYEGPFGVVFAYSLSNNSLDSLQENLREWQGQNPPSFWPNMIVVLGEGVIFNIGSNFQYCLHNRHLPWAIDTIALKYGGDTLFKFYAALIDLCSSMRLPPLELSSYYSPSRIVDGHIVEETEGFERGSKGERFRLGHQLVLRVLSESVEMTYGDILKCRFGVVPEHVSLFESNAKVFLYNPKALPPGRLESLDSPSLLNMHFIRIDAKNYAIALDGLEEDDFEAM